MTREEADLLGLNDDPDLIADPIERTAAQEKIGSEIADRRARQDEILRGRKVAFSRVFRDGNASKDDIKIVMDVLQRFCRWRTSTFHADPRLHAVAEGRREVLLLVDGYCELSIDELFNKLA